MTVKVLVVDDESVGRDSLKLLLSTCHYTVESAANGPQAIELAKTFQPEVVVIDWILAHEMTGLEVAESIRQFQPSARIILMSGRSDVRSLVPKESGFQFIAKPFQLPELLVLFSSTSSTESSN